MYLYCLYIQYMYHSLFFFFNDTATTEIYTLSLHDALPIYMSSAVDGISRCEFYRKCFGFGADARISQRRLFGWRHLRSEEHTSELQSRSDLVCRLLLEKKKKIILKIKNLK